MYKVSPVKEDCPVSGQEVLSCLEGFSLVLGGDGEVVFISTSCAGLVGLRQEELLGQCLADYVHPSDTV